MFRITAFLAALLLAAGPALAVVPTAGPFIGHVTDHSARIWMQFPIAGEVTVNIYDVAHGNLIGGIRVGLEGPSPFVCDLPISELQPNHTYRIDVKFDGDPVKLPAPELSIRTAPSDGDEATFAVAFGGGIAISPISPAATGPAPEPVAAAHRIPIFRPITELKPRAFLFLGDTGYLPQKPEDYPANHRAAYRLLADFHSDLRKEPDLQDLFRSTACYGIFGDHDFGPPGDFPYAQESLIAFQKFWPNPDWGTPANPGCFCTFTCGDVDFFLLDARTFRSAPAEKAQPRMLGEAQLAWLEKNLKASKASFKILAAPCILWGDDPEKPEPASWSRYPAEQKAFLQWLADNRINGIVGLAGGQSLGQLTRRDPAPGGVNYPLFSLASAKLLAEPAAPEPAPAADPRRVGAPVAGECFGTLDFGGEREHRFLTLRLRDAIGKTRVEQTLLAVSLRN